MSATVQTGPQVGTGGDPAHLRDHIDIYTLRQHVADEARTPEERKLASELLRAVSETHARRHRA